MALADIKIEVVDHPRPSKCDNCIYNITEKQQHIPILNFWGVNVDNTTIQEVLEWIELKIKQNQHRLIFFVNPACLNIAARDVEYFNALDRADRLLPDGVGLKIGCWLLNENLTTNLNGTDLFPQICNQAATNDNSIFLLGGEPNVANRAAITMQQQFPDLIIAGTHHGFFTPDEEAVIIDMINTSNASILFVGLGVPKQELWLTKVRPLLSPNICMGVGGLFDYYSGRIPRAPIWMRNIGLEWCWRLYQEPTRLWKRYIIGNPIFIQRILQQRIDLSKSQTYNTNICRPRLEKIKSQIAKLYKAATSNSTSYIKRCMDIIISLSLLIALAPLFLLTALLIYIDFPGPVLYKQTRVGKLGKSFTMWKFRSMCVGADAQLKDLADKNDTQCDILFKIKNDPRITKIGSIIRRTSIDELPQLWNVLKGDMSLVGPRPALPREVEKYSTTDQRRLEVKPGITCIWQVSGRSNIPFDEQVLMDIEYIDSHSIWLDIKLLWLTIPAVLTGYGAC